jgi:hypothetical protein
MVDFMRRTRRTASTTLGGILIALFCLVSVINSLSDYQNEQALRARGKETQAAVSQTILSSNILTGKTPRVKYQFNIQGVDYCYDDTLMRNYYNHISPQVEREANEWANMARPEWEIAEDAGVVAVLYLPENPWVNRPLAHPEGLLNPLTYALAQSVMYALIGLMALFVAVVGVQEKEDPANRQMRSLSDMVNKNPGKQD